ncbi:hypothetical protein RI367_008031 [Sorochytrium milnesiophthora]
MATRQLAATYSTDDATGAAAFRLTVPAPANASLAAAVAQLQAECNKSLTAEMVKAGAAPQDVSDAGDNADDEEDD